MGGCDERNGYGGVIARDGLERALDLFLGMRVQGCCGFVQEHDGGFSEEGAGDGDLYRMMSVYRDVDLEQ